MILTKNNGRYEFTCAKADRHIASDAGFIFEGAPRPVWHTRSARRALALVVYADFALAAEIEKKAKNEPDPEKVTLRLEGTIWRYYAPINRNAPAKYAQMRFKSNPLPHWWTEDPLAAAKCYDAARELPEFVCSAEDQEILAWF